MTPAGRGKATTPDLRSPAERHRAMSWAQRLKRVFGIGIATCEQCGGPVKVIASIEDPTVEIGRLVARRGWQPASPAAVAAGILGWQTRLMGCLKCLFPQVERPSRRRGAQQDRRLIDLWPMRDD